MNTEQDHKESHQSGKEPKKSGNGSTDLGKFLKKIESHGFVWKITKSPNLRHHCMAE
jgi:hypothetical protein